MWSQVGHRKHHYEQASGGDGIPLEPLQILKDDAVKVLHSICQQMWKTQLWPQDWKRSVPGASVRNSAHGKGHEEGGLAYAKAWSSLRKPPVPKHLTPKPESVLCSHLHLWLYGGLSPITVSLREGVNVQLQGNKNSWAWQECFSLRTALKVI